MLSTLVSCVMESSLAVNSKAGVKLNMEIPHHILRAQSVWGKNAVLNFLVGKKVLHISFYVYGIKTEKDLKRSKAVAFIYNILMYKCFVGSL